MPEKIYVITSGKGGVGKSTVTANLGASLALMGYRVALIDMDIGLRNLDVILGLKNRIIYDIVDVIRKRCSINEALVQDKKLDNLYLLPAAQREDKLSVSSEDLKNICFELSRIFNYILIDSPAGIEHGFKVAVSAAEKAIIVTTPDVTAIRDADKVVQLVTVLGLPKPWLIINRYQQRLARTGDMLSVEDIIEILRIDLLGVITENEKVLTSGNYGELVIYENSSMASKAFRSMALKLTGEPIPPFVPKKEEGIIQNILRAMGFSV